MQFAKTTNNNKSQDKLSVYPLKYTLNDFDLSVFLVFMKIINTDLECQSHLNREQTKFNTKQIKWLKCLNSPITVHKSIKYNMSTPINFHSRLDPAASDPPGLQSTLTGFCDRNFLSNERLKIKNLR